MNENKFEKIKKMICKKLRKLLFEWNNSLVFKLPDLSSKELYCLLSKKNLFTQAKKFYKENVNGSEFISIISNYHGMPILIEDFEFSEKEIEELKNLYIFIFKLRRIHFKKLIKKEIPFYI